MGVSPTGFDPRAARQSRSHPDCRAIRRPREGATACQRTQCDRQRVSIRAPVRGRPYQCVAFRRRAYLRPEDEAKPETASGWQGGGATRGDTGPATPIEGTKKQATVANAAVLLGGTGGLIGGVLKKSGLVVVAQKPYCGCSHFESALVRWLAFQESQLACALFAISFASPKLMIRPFGVPSAKSVFLHSAGRPLRGGLNLGRGRCRRATAARPRTHPRAGHEPALDPAGLFSARNARRSSGGPHDRSGCNWVYPVAAGAGAGCLGARPRARVRR